MATFSIGGFQFETTGSGRVIARGPGLPRVGLDVGLLSNLTPRAITSQLVNNPNVTPEGAEALQNAAVFAEQIKENLTAPAPQPAPPATAGETVLDDAPAGPTAAPEQTVGTNGRVIPPAETGTDAPTKTTEQTQAITTDSNSGRPVADPTTGNNTGTPVLQSGVGAPSDDAAEFAGTLQNTVDGDGNDDLKITPRPNVLDDYYSYNYSASVYLMSEDQYVRLLSSSDKSVDGYRLLFQTGGGPANNGGVREPPPAASKDSTTIAPADAPGVDGGRNPFFPDDFYIESITINTIPAGKGSGSAHNVSSMKFTVVEPNGITLLDNLYRAVQNNAPRDGSNKVNYTAVTYLMVLRFYGYDQNGSLVRVAAKPDPEGTSDQSAVIEKFIPFKIANLNWSVGSKLVSYEWDCTPVGQIIAGHTARGTIPYDVQLVDSTVGGLLGNNRVVAATAGSQASNNTDALRNLSRQASREAAASRQATADQNRLNENERATQNFNNSNEFAGMEEQGTSSAPTSATPKPAPANATSAPSKKVIKGLIGAMNEFQQDLVKRGIYTTADVYSIEFVGPGATAISGAKLQLPNTKIDKKQTAAGAPPSKEGGAALDPARQSVDQVSRTFSITAGQQLLQAIELVIRNSSYITNQALVIVNPDGTYTPNPKANLKKPMKWFEISMTASAIGNQLDPLRNDYAYNIKYVVRQKILPNFDSKYFPISSFLGVHKSYPYWFTGENTAVLEYQETLNSLYHVTVSGSEPKTSKEREAYTSSLADIRKYAYSPRSNASSQQADGKSLEANANAADVIYSPGDLAESKVKIIGDPAWIMQGSLFRDAAQIISSTTGFDPDGTISFDTTEPMFEIVWQRPTDYNIETGLADPYADGIKENSRVYVCKGVTSEFTKGSFTQTLEGVLYLFPVPGKTPAPATADTKRNSSGDENQNESAKFLRQQAAPPAAPAQSRLSDNEQATINYNNSNEFAYAQEPTAAVVGAQQNSKPAPSLTTSTNNTVLGNQSSLPGQLGSGTAVLETPPPPTLPSSGNGGTVTGVSSAIQPGPATLPAAGTNPTLIKQTTADASVNSTQPIVRES